MFSYVHDTATLVPAPLGELPGEDELLQTSTFADIMRRLLEDAEGVAACLSGATLCPETSYHDVERASRVLREQLRVIRGVFLRWQQDTQSAPREVCPGESRA